MGHIYYKTSGFYISQISKMSAARSALPFLQTITTIENDKYVSNLHHPYRILL